LRTRQEKALFGGYRNPLTDDESVKGQFRSTANTNAFVFAGKLWTMKEYSPALVMDPATMESRAFETWDGAMKSQTFTAHPKIDPATGNMVAIGYAASGLCTDGVSCMEIGPDGHLIREEWFKVPYYCMMHDFGITEDYLVLPIAPSIGSWERLEKGRSQRSTSPSGCASACMAIGLMPTRSGWQPQDTAPS
jgi:carotenoid cleavage dioxygenase-like enzyme